MPTWYHRHRAARTPHATMADEGESQTDVLARIREQGSAFEHMTDRTDEKINDGSNYAGLMRPEDYKKKRVEVTMTEEEVRAKKVAAATARINADREAARAADGEREARERARKEKFQREQEAAAAAAAADDGAGNPKKKQKKKKAAPSGLSFDADEEG